MRTSSIFAHKARPVKPHRVSPASTMPFGAGLGTRYVPFTAAPAPSPSDRVWAAEAFADAPEHGAYGGHPTELAMMEQEMDDRLLEQMAAEWEFESRYDDSLATGAATCSGCGAKDDFIDETTGLCPVCQLRLETAQEDSSMSSLYLAATGRRMVC